MYLAAAMLLLTAAEADTRPDRVRSVAGIVVLADAEKAGHLQHRLDGILKTHVLRTMVASQSAAGLGVHETKAEPALREDHVRQLLASAKMALYTDRPQQAEALLTTADAELARAGAPASLVARAQLWRAAVELADGRQLAARKSVERALRIAPELEVPLDTFRPSMATFVAKIRDGMGAKVPMSISPLPEHARVLSDRAWIDNRRNVYPGTYQLVVRAPGFVSAVQTVTVTAAGWQQEVPLPLRLQAAFRRTVQSLTWSEATADAIAPALADTTRRLAVDCLVLVADQPVGGDQVRALWWCRDGTIARSEALSVLGDWRAAAEPWLKDFVRAAHQPPEFKASSAAQGETWSLIAAGGAGVAILGRSVTDASGRRTQRFVGPSIHASTHLRSPAGLTIRGEFNGSHGISKQSIDSAMGEVSVSGGTHLRARLGLGYAFRWNVGLATFEATAGLLWNSLVAQDAVIDGHRSGVMPSYLSWGADTEVRAKWAPLKLTTDAALHVDVFAGFTPIRAWSSTPARAYGAPFAKPAYRGGGSVGLRLNDFELALAYSGSHSEVRFSGQSLAPLDPPLIGARLRQIQHHALVVGQLRF